MGDKGFKSIRLHRTFDILSNFSKKSNAIQLIWMKFHGFFPKRSKKSKKFKRYLYYKNLIRTF